MSDALEEHDGKVSISSRNIINLQFAKDLDAVAEEEQEQETLGESLNKTCTNSSSTIQMEIRVKGANARYRNKLY